MIKSFQKIDTEILDFVDRHLHYTLLDKIMPIITGLGNYGMVWSFLLIYLIFSNNYRIEGYLVIASLILTTIVGEGIVKHLIRRSRPFASIEHKSLLISRPITYSFPSGHSASSFAVAGIFIMMNSSISIYVTVLASLIAFSRIYLKVHYLSDVLTGIILGFICSMVVFYLFSTMG